MKAIKGKTIKKTAYIVVDTGTGYDIPTSASGGYPYVFFNLEEAKQKLANIVSEWNCGGNYMKPGHNDGEEWAETRYDEDQTIAWRDIEGNLDKVEIFEKEIEIPIQ